MNIANEDKILELKLRPVWEEIERAREECNSFLEGLGSSEETRDALCMITSEILENAIKYGHFADETDEFTFKIEAGRDGILVQAWSPVPAVGITENLRRLDTIIQWIRSFQSPFQAYLERLKLVAGQPLEDIESGLGLIRIAYEGEAILDFYVNENDILYVSALQPKLQTKTGVAI
ncbi:MAG: ATP-binding protein [Leptospira sp.]|nr:ATP-binding protein [Leptospira sp.]